MYLLYDTGARLIPFDDFFGVGRTGDLLGELHSSTVYRNCKASSFNCICSFVLLERTLYDRAGRLLPSCCGEAQSQAARILITAQRAVAADRRRIICALW